MSQTIAPVYCVSDCGEYILEVIGGMARAALSAAEKGEGG